MYYVRLIHLAFINLQQNKGKSFLTMLGIIIGVTSVVMIISIGAGAQSLIFNQIQGAGSNLISIIPGGQDEDEQGPPAAVQGIIVTTLTYDDALAIGEPANVPNVVAATPYVRGNVTAKYQSESRDTIISGVSAQFPEVIEGTVVDGRFFTEEEDATMARVAVLGQEVKERFFNGASPVGKIIRLNTTNFRVVGVLEERGTRGFENQDDQIYVPGNTAQKVLLGIRYVGLIRAKVDNPDNFELAINDIESLLRERHNLDREDTNDFTIANQMDALDALGSITDALRFFLAAVAAISLLVGGIGIMNIMLVTVTERTREIGLRKAIGAKKRSIVAQFLIEAAIISLVGGVIGLVIGTLFSFLVSVVAKNLGYDWDFVVSMQSIILALSVSAGTGIVFGWYPASKASKLNPIEALRYE